MGKLISFASQLRLSLLTRLLHEKCHDAKISLAWEAGI